MTETVRLRDLIDILLMAFFLYTIIVWGRQARVGRILSGLGSLGLVYLTARLLELQLTVWVFQGLFAVLAIVLIVIFQSELRQLFERLAAWSVGDWGRLYPSSGTTEPLVNAISKLASANVGALIVIAGRDSIERHVAGGIPIDALVSAPFVESIFDKHSPGHDGALLLRGNRASHFALHLPLSTDFDQLKGYGTRHAAALGLAERTDVLCIVVSEERGRISVAEHGRLEQLHGTAELASRIDEFVKDRAIPSGTDGEQRILSFRKHWLEKVVAVVIASVAWIVFVSDLGIESRVIRMPVVVQNVPPALTVAELEPEQVSVMFRASREDFQGLDAERMAITLNAAGLTAGRHMLATRSEDVNVLPGLEVVEIEPEMVNLFLVESEEDVLSSETPR